MRFRRRWSFWLWSAAIAMGALLAAVLVAQPPRASGRARMIAAGSWPPPSNRHPSDWLYFWLTDREILFFRRDPASGQVRGFRRDTVAGTEVPSGLRLPPDADFPRLSPDRQWLAWDTEGQPAGAVRIDGSRQVSLRRDPLKRPNPMPPYRHDWSDVVWKNGGPHVAARDPKTARATHVPLTALEQLWYYQRITPTMNVIVGNGFTYTTRQTNVGNRGKRLNVVQYRVSPAGTLTVARKMVFVPPPKPQSGFFVPSPRNDRFVFATCTVPSTHPLREKLERMIPHLRSQRVHTDREHRVWSIAPDGSPPRLLHVFRADVRFPYMLEWTPDGRRVSIIHDNALWVAPVD